jgi:phosphatidylserine decarboxylase
MHLLTTIRNVLFVPIHPKGWPFIIAAGLVAVVLLQFSEYAGLLGGILTLFCVYFFRNPNRMVPQGEGFVLASGDGVISHITRARLPKELQADDTEYHKISIFLNVFNVHVNRLPTTGRITGHQYIAGKFLNAALDKASDDNERTVTMLQNNQGHTIGFAQIAGFVARRIICDLAPQQQVKQGERYGIIRFGSRCDIYVPLHYSVLVQVGTTAVGGETMLAVDPATFAPATLTWQTV